jgi:hypothetical protein
MPHQSVGATSMSIVTGAATPLEPTKGSKTEGPGGTVVLSLTYTLDSHSPEIFRLKNG